jgi:tetratricopeptide (TPR) repeat protein
MTLDLDRLLAQADLDAGRGEWDAAHRHLAQAAVLAPHDPGIASAVGTCLLQLKRLPEAREAFGRAADLAPEVADAFNHLGFAHALCGDGPAAEQAFRRALELDPDHGPATRNLAQIYLDMDRLNEGVHLLVDRIRRFADDVEALVMLAHCYEVAEDFESARTLYRQALNLAPDNPDLHVALASVTEEGQSAPTAAPAVAQRTCPVAFWAPSDSAESARVLVPARSLGADARIVRRAEELAEAETVVFARPHLSAEIMGVLEAAAQRGLRVIVDMDYDPEQLPVHYGRHAHLAGDEARRAFDRALALADLTVVPDSTLAARLEGWARHVSVIATGWSRANRLWEQPAPARPNGAIQVGWYGDAAARPELAALVEPVTAALLAHPTAMLNLAGDPGAYALFHHLPEARKRFLPNVAPDDLPYLLAHFDLQLIPGQRGVPGHDTQLMSAGARGLPWLANPTDATQAWLSAGVVCADVHAWREALIHLLSDAEMREHLGTHGRLLAATREADQIGAAWRAALAR